MDVPTYAYNEMTYDELLDWRRPKPGIDILESTFLINFYSCHCPICDKIATIKLSEFPTRISYCKYCGQAILWAKI